MKERGLITYACRRSPGMKQAGFGLFDSANPPDSHRTQAPVAGVPVKRLGLPENVANSIAFSLDARSGFAAEQTLHDGP